MLRSEIEKKLLESVKIGNNDDSKKTAIMEWCSYYWIFLENCFEYELNFIAEKLSENSSWNNEVTEINKEKLDKKIILKEEKNPLKHIVRYKIACCSCNENYIRSVFNELQPKEPSKYIKALSENCLMDFWSHYINKNVVNHIEGKNTYEDGFEHAMKDKNVGALNFFWENIIKNDISNEKKEEIIMSPAIYSESFTGTSADMIEFSIKNIKSDQYHKLLEKDLEKNGEYYILYKLISENRFNSTEKVFKCLKPLDLSPEGYAALMFEILDQLASIAKEDLKETMINGEKLVSTLWNLDGFEKQHRESLIKEISDQYSSIRIKMVYLIDCDVFDSKILLDIVKSIPMENMEHISKYDQPSADILNKFIQNFSFIPESNTCPGLKADTSLDSPKLLFPYKGPGDVSNQ